LPVIFLTVFLLPNKALAQNTSDQFTPFRCLFEKQNSNGTCSNDPQPLESDIKRGAASGVVYGKTDKFSQTGVESITMILGLFMDVTKEKADDKYYYNRVADAQNETFILRMGFKEPITGQIKYKLFDIPYLRGNVQVTGTAISGGIEIKTTTVNTASGQYTGGIAFYKVGGENGNEFIKQQVILATNVSTGVEALFGTPLTADFWYCGGLKDNDPSKGVDGRYAPRGDRVEYFTKDGKSKNIDGTIKDDGGYEYESEKCGGTAYYKIGKTISFNLPASKEAAQIDSEQNLESGITATEYVGSTLPLCSITPWGDGSVMGCVAQILYHGVFRPVAFFAMLMGRLFDFFIGYSLSDESYRHDFIQTGWQLVRDISNIFFIVIMIYSGLAAVFGISKVSYKSVIPTLVINALIINFSLFATRIVIDMSNIVARIFYNQMVVKIDGQEQKAESSATGYKPISEAIVSSFNPQKIFEGSVLTAEPTSSGEKDDESDVADFNSQSENQGATGFKRYSKEYAGYFTLVTLVAIAISFSVAMMFWKTAFMFVGRVIGLYVAMIFSPFAFLSRGNVPLVNKIGSLNFSSWWGDLSKYALLAPIFIFFLYIINAFLNVEFFTKVGLDQNGDGFFGKVMYVVIPMLIIYGLVSRGVGIAEKLAGEYAKMAQKFATGTAGAVVGGALGIATGGIAVAGRNVIGRFGSRLASSQRLQNASSQGGIRGALADRAMRSGSFLSRANYDARNNNFINSRLREFGSTNTRIGGLLGTNQTNTTGGFQGAISREVATQTSRADRMLVTGQQAAMQDARNSAWENAYQAARNTAQQNANTQGTVFDENAFRTTYLTNQTTAGNPRPQTTAEINRQREQQNNARLARPSTIQRIANRATNRVTTPTGVTGAATGGAGLAAGAAAAAITGGAAVAAATIVGQGAIQNAAQQQVARQRAQNARNPLSANQITNLQNRLGQLQAELTRRITLMNTIGSSINPPVNFQNLTPANIIDYQADRQSDINSRQVQIDAEQDFIDRNKNNPAMTNQVNQSRSTVRTLTNEQNNLRNDLRQAGNILNEYNRINSDITGVRQQLGI